MVGKEKNSSVVAQHLPGSLFRFVGPKYWPVWAALIFLRLAIMLPLSMQLWLGRRLGEILFYLMRGRRFFAARNLELCFPEIDETRRRMILKESFHSLGMSVFETAMGWWASSRRMQGLYEIEGLDEVGKGLAHGHGVILLTAHFTSLDLCGRMLNHAGLSYDAMYRRLDHPLLQEIMRRGRERCAQTAISKRDLRGIIRSLRNNRPLWYAPDQSSWGSMSAMVPFFGEPAATSVATVSIARSSKARVVPFVAMRDGNKPYYRLRILPALDDFPGNDPIADTLRINRVIENWIRECPSQYYWIHRRFKHRPEEYGDAYAQGTSVNGS